MHERIRLIRKTLKLTLAEFGKAIGLGSTAICDIEHQRCNATERVIIAICAKYHVNEKWLKTGEGEMFITTDIQLDEFFNIFNQLSEPLQSFLIETANNLLKLQDKL